MGKCVDSYVRDQCRLLSGLYYHGSQQTLLSKTESDATQKMSSLQIPRWTAKEVADWLRGLDDCLQQYVQAFLNKGYTGERLLKITPQDLDELKITKLGHQEILLEAIELLKGINYDQPEENLQTVLLCLNTKATNLKNELEKIIPATRDASALAAGSLSIPANILLRVADTVTAAKTLISWLDRPPFCRGEDDFQVVRREVLQHALDITQAVQKTTDVHGATKTILQSSQELMLVTDSMIKQATDPLVISPTFIEEVTIKKKHQDEDLGLFLKTSSIDGVHFITGTKDESAAGVVGKVHPGDEVVQVNYQTVVAWEHRKVIEMVKEDPMSVMLTLRKRPKNLSTPGQIQRSPQNNFPIYRNLRPTHQEKPQTRSRKNSDPTTMIKRDLDAGGPRGAHSDNETEPLDFTFDEESSKGIQRNRCGTTVAALRRPHSTRGSRHLEERPRSLPEDITEITGTNVADWLRSTQEGISPIAGSPPSSDSQQTPSPKADNSTGVTKQKKSVRIVETNTNNNTETSPCKIKESPKQEISRNDSLASIESSVSSISSVSQNSYSYHGEEKASYKTVVCPNGEEVQVRRRKKKRRYTVNKHVSCVDLGPGECEGYLHMRKTRKNFGNYKWVEMWFVLKEYVLYYYKNRNDDKAKGVICLPGYKVQEAPDINKKFAFKATHTGTEPLYFRGQTESDKNKWLNKLGLAAILFETKDQDKFLRQSVVFKKGLLKGSEGAIDTTKPMPRIQGYHSESDDEESPSMQPQDFPDSKETPEEKEDTPKTPPSTKGQKYIYKSPENIPTSPRAYGSSGYSPSIVTSPPPFLRRLKGTTSSSPSTPNNTPTGSPTILKRMMTAIRRRSETTLFFSQDQIAGFPKTPARKISRSVSTPDFLEDESSGSPEGDMLKHYDSLKNSNVPVLGLDRTKAARVSRRESQKKADWYRQQLQQARDARNDKAVARRALQQSLMDRKDALNKLEIFFKGPINHDTVQSWKTENEDLLTHTIERLNSSKEKEDKRDSSSEGAGDSDTEYDVHL